MRMARFFPQKSTRYLAGLVIVSLGFTLAQSGPLNGSTAALALTVLFQVYLPGYLLARRLGKLRIGHSILRFAWILVSGLSLAIVLGGAARLLNLPVVAWLVALHALMLVLAALPASDATGDTWRLSRQKLPLYLLVALCCLTLLGISYASRYRFYGFEDQVIFVSHASWLANNPGETPQDQPLRSRQIGAINRRDSRFDTDGWTYNHAAWVWASGVSATQLIWFDLDPLFVWAVPLVIFALAYEITRREEAAAWSAAALTLAGIMTLDNITLYPGYTAFGRLSVVQVTTLRQASLAFMLPLTLMVGFSYLRTFGRRDLFMIVLAGLALAIMHPFQIMLFVMSMGVTAALKWLAKPERKTLYRLLWLAAALILVLTLPFVQRLNRSSLNPTSSLINNERVEAVATPVAQGAFLLLPDVPLVGDTFIRNPAAVFYHPIIALAVILGLLYGLRWRRSLAAQYIFGATALAMILFFTPGLTEFYNKFVSSVGLLTSMFLLPVALTLGLSLDHALRWLGTRSRYTPITLTAGLWAVSMALLLFEPLPIPASARDQIETFNQMQQYRRLLPVHPPLAAALNTLLDPHQTSVLMAPDDSASVIIEDLPRTLITGGRGSANRARSGDNRFYNNLGSRIPWLDSDDLAFMAEFGVTHIVNRPDNSRFAQMTLQSDRFVPSGGSPGYAFFALASRAETDTVDALFATMNEHYASIAQPRWGPDGFVLVRPGDPATWGPIADQWTALLEQNPGDDRVRLGLAYSNMMMGADDLALPLWRRLHEVYPAVALFTDAIAYSHHILGDPSQGAQTLLAALDNDTAESRVLAARTLLTENFFYLLDDTQLDTVLAVTEADALAWGYLAHFDQPNAIRDRVALLMNVGRWDTAIDWLDQLPDIMISPADIAAQAAMQLAQGDINGALNRLRPTTDPDWRSAKAFWQPDRWADNSAAQLYHLLVGAVAWREGRHDDAINAYERAIDAGATLTGRYFLAGVLEQAGQAERAAQVRTEFEAGWPDATLEPVSLLTLADKRALYVMQPQVTADEVAGELTVEAIFSNFRPHDSYPVRIWRIEIVSPDSATRYATIDAPATVVDPFPVRARTTLSLPVGIEPLTQALVFITPLYSNPVKADPALVPVTLNRPGDVPIPENATTVDLNFGDAITLESYTLATDGDRIDLMLYWQTAAVLAEDYQIFVHVLDSDGDIITQTDTAPLQGRYPTGQWRAHVTIADAHRLSVENLPENFSVRVGLYRLPDATRLSVSPVDERVQDNSILLHSQ